MLPEGAGRKIPRSIYEAARNVARSLFGTEPYAHARDRKKVEMLFAHLKRILQSRTSSDRGPRGAQDEFRSPPSPRTAQARQALHPAAPRSRVKRALRRRR